MSGCLWGATLNFLNNFKSMLISYKILNDFLKLPKSVSMEDISKKLTDHTVEVEGVIYQSKQFDNVVVGKVLSVAKHPQADRLNIAEVDVKSEKLRIVCGAPNLQEGQMVPVAKIGAILPGEFEIKESVIRGEKSYGMICAEDELGLGNEHDGIMILSDKAKLGIKFSDYLQLNDIVFEIDNKSLSNRPDLLNHYGIARELSAIYEVDLVDYKKLIKDIVLDSSEKLEVKNEVGDMCQRYQAVRVDNIKIKESPTWLKERLVAIGQRPINVIVDIGNYVMFEMGQPLHAFNADVVKKITIRRAKRNEKIETLDDKDRTLDEDDLVIANETGPIALAGIMGGKNSSVNDKTTSIIIESANFKDSTIRKTAQKQGLRTESSIRFEKSLDPEMTETAMLRYLTILNDIFPEMIIATNIVDDNKTKNQSQEISFSYKWLESRIGMAIDRKKSLKQLTSLGFVVSKEEDDNISVIIPSYRATKDVKIKEDILEEVLRMHGYNNIESKLPKQEMSLPIVNELRLFERNLKNFFSLKHSMTEMCNYSFVGDEQLNKIGIDSSKHLRLANPLSSNHNLLRQSLVPNLLMNIKNNQNKKDSLSFFELGNVFINTTGYHKKSNDSDEVLPHQEGRLAVIIASGNEDEIFVETKGIAESLVSHISNNRANLVFVNAEDSPSWCDEKQKASLVIDSQVVGFVSLFKSVSLDNFNIKKSVACFEISISTLYSIYEKYSNPLYIEPNKYPAVSRDLAFVIDEEIMYNDIKETISSFSPLVSKVELFDIYSGSKLETGKKSLAFNVEFASNEKTLTSKEVDEIQSELINILFEKYSAQLRNY